MYFWNVKEISPSEYHVIETRYENEPGYILAKCSGPVPAGEIVSAMKIAQNIRLGKDTINNSLTGIKMALEHFIARIN